MAFSSPDEVFKFIADEKVEYVDVRFCDLPGVVQHFSIPASAFDATVFEDGLGFDGSSVRGFQSIHESDMLLLPDISTAKIDPFRAAKTLNVNFFVHDPFTREAYSRDPRNVARKAEQYLTSTGIVLILFVTVAWGGTFLLRYPTRLALLVIILYAVGLLDWFEQLWS